PLHYTPPLHDALPILTSRFTTPRTRAHRSGTPSGPGRPAQGVEHVHHVHIHPGHHRLETERPLADRRRPGGGHLLVVRPDPAQRDRKSTRLNSSHVKI